MLKVYIPFLYDYEAKSCTTSCILSYIFLAKSPHYSYLPFFIRLWLNLYAAEKREKGKQSWITHDTLLGVSLVYSTTQKKHMNTVDGRNPAPVDR